VAEARVIASVVHFGSRVKGDSINLQRSYKPGVIG